MRANGLGAEVCWLQLGGLGLQCCIAALRVLLMRVHGGVNVEIWGISARRIKLVSNDAIRLCLETVELRR